MKDDPAKHRGTTYVCHSPNWSLHNDRTRQKPVTSVHVLKSILIQTGLLLTLKSVILVAGKVHRMTVVTVKVTVAVIYTWREWWGETTTTHRSVGRGGSVFKERLDQHYSYPRRKTEVPKRISWHLNINRNSPPFYLNRNTIPMV